MVMVDMASPLMLVLLVSCIGLSLANPAPQEQALDWADIQYQTMGKHPRVPMQEYLMVQTLDKLGISYAKAGTSFEAIMYKKYGPECSKRVIANMHGTIQCVKRQLDLAGLDGKGAPGLLAMQSGNPAAFVCRLVNLDGVIDCAEKLQNSGKLACTHDNMIRNEARVIAAVARAARHLCREDGELFGRGLRQLQTCEAEPFQRYSGQMQACTSHFQQMVEKQVVPAAGVGPDLFTDSLEAVGDVTESCPAMVRLAQCLPPAVGHCSPILSEVATDALREVVFRGLCMDTMDEKKVMAAVDDFGRVNYLGLKAHSGAAELGMSATSTLMVLLAVLL